MVTNASDRSKAMPNVASFLSIADDMLQIKSVIELKLSNGSLGIQTASNRRYYVGPQIRPGACT